MYRKYGLAQATYSSSEMTRMSSSSSSSSASSSPVLFTSSQSSSSQFHDSAEESGDTGVVERRYGGPPARDAALVIQRAFRRYSMVKEFHRIKTERRISRRINNNVAATPGTNGCEICIDLNESREEGLEVEDDDDSSSCLHSSACADVTEVEVEVDQHSHTSSASTSTSSSSLGQLGLTNSSPNNASSSSSSSSKLHNHSDVSSSHRNIHLHHLHQQTPPVLHHHPMQIHPIRHHIPPPSSQSQSSHQVYSQQSPSHQYSSGGLSGKNNSSSTSMSSCISPNLSTSSVCTSSGSPKTNNHQSHMGVICQPVMSDAECEIVRKRLYRVGLNLFNKKPEVGITYLVKKKFLEGSASAVSRFLISRKGLSKQMIGEYLANLQSPFSMACLELFAKEIDLSSMPIDLALRRFQSFLRMPGEAQKIERIMESFSRRFAACNPNTISQFRQGADTVFVMAFAIIMLNTDLHTPHLKQDRRMKMEDFIKNLRGIDEGADIDREILVGIYERIKQNEFKTGSDHVTQVMKVQQTIVGKKPNLAVPHRRLVCYCRLYEVTDVNKREKLGSHQREVFLFNDLLVLTKIFHKKRNSVTYSFRQSYPLAGIHLVLFANQHYEFGLSLRRGETVLLNLNARNESDRAKFTEDLREAIAESDEMARIESLSKENRDSGVDVGRIKRFSNSLLDINDQCKPTRRGSCGSLDSGMSVSFHSDENHQNQQQQQNGHHNNQHQSNIQTNGHNHHAHNNQNHSLARQATQS
ncbi:unnamed protein product [Allacma fusca]|uniref:SEC7 domain-containing protein n=1 Tax=Allacma fusca TaxID=39272 RepID=A0A8J2MGF7_9HEXA|nr:unnamed protein product [Allacma fusca]